MRPVRLLFSLLALSCLYAAPSRAAESEPRVFVLGIWPNQLRFFDEATESFVADMRLRYGAVTSYGPTTHTPGYERIFYITDRMEAVEVVDPARREVVNELRLSTPEQRVRFYAAAPDAEGKLLYLRGTRVAMGVDRMEAEESQVFVYDLEHHAFKEAFRIPEAIGLGFFDVLRVAPGNGNLLTFGSDIYELDASDRSVVRTLKLSKPRLPGYGPIQPIGLTELEGEPGVFIGLYSTTDPALNKQMLGVLRVSLAPERVETFELGPAIEADTFALSPDGRYAYAGPKDLIKIDMKARRVVAMKKGFERGRTNNTLIVSSDGAKLYVGGVGDHLYLVDAGTLERIGTLPVGGDIMSPPLVLPAAAAAATATRGK